MLDLHMVHAGIDNSCMGEKTREGTLPIPIMLVTNQIPMLSNLYALQGA